MLMLLGMTFFASSTDVMANFFQLPLKSVLWFFRFAVVIAPIIAYFVTYKICLEMRAAEGIGKRKRAVIVERSATGEYSTVESPPRPGDGIEELEAVPVPTYHRPGAARAGHRRGRPPGHALSPSAVGRSAVGGRRSVGRRSAVGGRRWSVGAGGGRTGARAGLTAALDVPPCSGNWNLIPPDRFADAPVGPGSGDKQAEAELCLLETDKVAVTFGPPTGCEVITERPHCPLFGVWSNLGPDRNSATYTIIEVCLGPTPIGLEEAVSAVPGDRHRFHVGTDGPSQLGQRRPANEEVSNLRQVVAGKPEPATPPGIAAVKGEHHRALSNALHLHQTRDRVRPVVDRGEGHRRVEGLVLERKALRYGRYARCRTCGPLGTHQCRRIHGDYVTAGRFVGASTSPDVHYGSRITERGPDPAGDPRFGAPCHRVGGSDAVIQLLVGHVTALSALTNTTAAHPARRRPGQWVWVHLTTLSDRCSRGRSMIAALIPNRGTKGRWNRRALSERRGWRSGPCSNRTDDNLSICSWTRISWCIRRLAHSTARRRTPASIT